MIRVKLPSAFLRRSPAFAPQPSGYPPRSSWRLMAVGARHVVLAIWGAVVVGGIDNVLRPLLVGNRLRLHTIPAFISMIGGLVFFGAPGFILGPLAVTVTILLVEILGRSPGIQTIVQKCRTKVHRRIT